MTQIEFYERTNYTPKAGESFDFWAMHEDYCESGMDKDEYCKSWIEGYKFFGFAKGVKNDVTREMESFVPVRNAREEWINTPDSVLAQVGCELHGGW